jgi:crotonobetainyl-CoA:carnitine CoA-transferase CaiB-like acyl-CoA transferase
MSRPVASLALQHLQVLDLTRVRAGPTCCRVLADFGADVIKIEAPPGVDPNENMLGLRSSYDNQNLHRNKRSLTLNLKHQDGLALFMKLAETADIVVENFRPDVKDRLGIGYEALAARNPRIILASISGFGQDGPYRKRAGFDQIAQGMGGFMSITGKPSDGPMRAGIALADSSAGLYAALGILVALAERERSGRGQWVHTSLLEAQIALCDFQAALYLVDGKVPQKAGNDHPYATPMGTVPVADGFINIGVGGDGQWRAFCAAIERPELADHPDYVTQPLRQQHRAALMDLLNGIFKMRSGAEWIERMERAGVPSGPIYAMDEVFADPQVRHLGIAQKVSDGRPDIRLVGQPVTLSRTPASLVTPIPEAGEHTAEILREAGLDEAQIATLRAKKVV